MVGHVTDASSNTSGQDRDSFVAKYNEDGSLAWRQAHQSMITSNGDETLHAVETFSPNTSSKEHVYVGGFIEVDNGQSKRHRDAVIAEFTTSATHQKTSKIGKNQRDMVLDLASNDTSNTIYAALSVPYSVFGSNHRGKKDGLVLQYNKDFQPKIQSSKIVGTPEHDRISSIASSGTKTYVSGWTCGQLGNRQSPNAPDGFVMELQ